MAPGGLTERRYQTEAIAAVVARLRDGGRGKLLCACGTGKTVMCLRAATLLAPAGLIVVVAPSIGLVGQTLDTWRRHHPDIATLAVCSDTTVARDPHRRRTRGRPGSNREDRPGRIDDLDAEVTTSPDIIDAWLRATSTQQPRLIVGTHASAAAIGEGLHLAARAADMLIVDEAHHTAGAADKDVMVVHDDALLPATRRLYATATPRLHTGRGGDGEQRVLGMDDEAVFGPVLYDYPLSRGIAEGYLDDFRVLVIGVTPADLPAQAPRSPAVRGGWRHPDHMAMVQAATARAARDYHLRRVVTFCPRVRDARHLADTFAATIAALPPEHRPARPVHADHVHGGMRQRQRRDILAALADPPADGWTVVANVDCLGEGIDLPAIDAVAFTYPKSPRDAVQAIGRALRPHPDSAGVATIIVPILLPDTPEHDPASPTATGSGPVDLDTLTGTAFDTLWQVIRALRDHDHTFGAALDIARAHGPTAHTAALSRVVFDLPGHYAAPEVVQRITVRLVESATSSWWRGYGHLLAHQQRTGDANPVATTITDDGYKLGQWCHVNRTRHRRGLLPADRVDALTRVGFEFDPHAAAWEQAFAAATGYQDRTGHLRPPEGHREGPIVLRSWLTAQRTAHRRGTLTPDRARRLTALGLRLAPPDFTERVAGLADFHRTHGRLPDSRDTDPAGARLRTLLVQLRSDRTKNRLSPEQIAHLDSWNMPWNGRVERAARQWQHGLLLAQRFHARHGHLDTGRPGASAPTALLTWLARQRRTTLTPDQRAALDALGMLWNPLDTTWQTMIDALRAHHHEHGNLQIPHGITVQVRGNHLDLARWLSNVRAQHHRGELAAQKARELGALGVTWESPRAQWWEDVVDAARTHHARHGHLRPDPDTRTAAGTLLGTALNSVRRRHRRGTVPEQWRTELDALDMDWEPEDSWWRQLVDASRAHIAEHGHLHPGPDARTAAGTSLRSALATCRSHYRGGTVPHHWRPALDALGLPGDPSTTRPTKPTLPPSRPAAPAQAPAEQRPRRTGHTWHDSLAAAQRHTARNGHLLPTTGYRDPDTGINLTTWLSTQRRTRHHGTLAPDRIRALDAIGMIWNPADAYFEHGLRLARDLHATQGTLALPVNNPHHGIDLRGDPFNLLNFLNNARARHAAGTLTPERVAALTAIGLDWEPHTTALRRNTDALLAYHAQHGTIAIPRNHPLHHRLTTVRRAHRDNRLPPDCTTRLNAAGITWNAAHRAEQHRKTRTPTTTTSTTRDQAPTTSPHDASNDHDTDSPGSRM